MNLSSQDPRRQIQEKENLSLSFTFTEAGQQRYRFASVSLTRFADQLCINFADQSRFTLTSGESFTRGLASTGVASKKREK
jgi:hypothetical protein